ncbi:MAG: hypothetical protein JWM11_3763 [Planctomycetaceae bacterium]|nr:hypothetical protein [Planctomycetaceae bacterium]
MQAGYWLNGRFWTVALVLGACSAYTAEGAFVTEYVSGIMWAEPKIVEPGPIGGPPADATVLFDGKDLGQWNGGDKWKVENGYAISQGGGINSKQSFGDCQLHLEFASPSEVKGSGQGRGNSGIYFMETYEVQILDSFDNKTYFDGQCGSIYKQYPPLVNACRKPGEWQTYDIVFTAPRFDEKGAVTSKAYLTVLQNGVLVQNHSELLGGTFYDKAPSYTAHAAKRPLHIQFHGDPVRFRNIWVREIPPQALIAK